MFTIHSTLTEEEKWYFDLHGFLVLRNVIPKDEIAEMLEVLRHWLTIDESAFRHHYIAEDKNLARLI